MSSEPTNDDRAAWAENAVETFTLETYGGRHFSDLVDDDRETAIYDLVANLLHLAKRESMDTDRIVRMAQFHFEAEDVGD